MADKEYQLTDLHHFVTHGTAEAECLNPLEWFSLVRRSLESSKPILSLVAENSSKSITFELILNRPLEGGGQKERRITSKEVADGLPKTFRINNSWLFIPVKTLETKEEKGQFFERRLFVLADLAVMIIVDTTYRKEPHPNQSPKVDKPKINENVVSCRVMTSAKLLGLEKEGFEETIMPYFKNPELKLGEYMVKNFFDDAIDALRDAKNCVTEMERAMKPFMEIRTRLGFWNNI